MEDTLRELYMFLNQETFGLNPCFNGRYSQRWLVRKSTQTETHVLILVLMEDTLRDNVKLYIDYKGGSLNPCFNGRYSQRIFFWLIEPMCGSLNPCFNGRYSQSGPKEEKKKKKAVLILVLMEDTLRVFKPESYTKDGKSLNPCFNGRYSQRKFGSKIQKPIKVLILVLMEDTLRDRII